MARFFSFFPPDDALQILAVFPLNNSLQFLAIFPLNNSLELLAQVSSIRAKFSRRSPDGASDDYLADSDRNV